MFGGFFDISEVGAKNKMISNTTCRVIFLLALLAISASLQDFLWVSISFTVVFTLCLVARIKWTYVFLRMLLLIPFGLGAIVLLPFTVGERDIEVWGGFGVSKEGVTIALLLICKLLICHFIICLLLSTTSPTELFNTFIKLGFPVILVEIMKITLRYMAVLMDEIDRMLYAQQSRGLSIRSFASWSSYRRSGELLGVLLIRSYHRSMKIHDAMISRGLHSSDKE
ncbi:cobalt ECF transporter T component CbiQ [Bacillus sp. AK128]